MADIFISYKHEEQPIAKKLADTLEKKGWTVWWDPEIRAGERFDDVIEKALIESKCVVVLWSNLSVESQNVKDEATYALNRDKLVPILIEEVNLPFRFERINTGQLIDWDGSDKFPGFQKLIADVISILGEPPVEEEKRKREQAERDAEKEHRRKQEAEKKLREDEKKKAEEERQRLEEEQHRLAEEKREFEEEQMRIEAARKAEEERKQKEAEAKRKAEEEQKRKEAERERKPQVERKAIPPKPATTGPITTEAAKDDTKLAEPKPSEQKPGIKKPAEKSPAKKIGILIASFVVIVVGAILLFRQEPTKSRETSSLRKFTNNIGMEFVLISAGKFVMGSPSDEPERGTDERQHEVNISNAFYLQTTEVSQGQWKRVMGNNPSRFKDCGDDCPVERVSWNGAQQFISKLNQVEGTNKYRLPTETEWEYACRAKTTTPFFTGECISTDQANYNGQNPGTNCPKGDYRGRTVKVGSFQPNAWGLYDMHGNVWEWCQDRYGDYPLNSVADPKGPDKGEKRVLRGGSWHDIAWDLRSALRDRNFPDIRYDYGFRVARDL